VLGRGARAGGMPLYKYVANRILTLIQNLCLAQKLTEYHTGYRAFSRHVLETLPLDQNSDDFVFDNQMIVQLIYFGYEVAKYFEEASSINWWRSIRYGLGVLATTFHYVWAKAGFTPRDFLVPRPHEAERIASPASGAIRREHADGPG
jgi:hypothetical protein